MESGKEYISEHIFVFPFSWKLTSHHRVGLANPYHQLKEKCFMQLDNWKSHYSEIEDDQDYNEFVYFYKPIRAALYTFNEETLIVKNYDFMRLDASAFFQLSVGAHKYTLDIHAIKLKLYKTGIGLLSFELINKCYHGVEEIKAINSFSKCIYPPILPIEKAKDDLFPNCVLIRLNEETYFEELFALDYYKETLCISPLIMGVLGEPFKVKVKNRSEESILIEPILGNQMYCCCIYQNAALVEEILGQEDMTKSLERLMILGKRMNYHNEGMEGKKNAYYLKNEFNIYCVSRFMLLCITKTWAESKLYNQLITLVLMQRATLLNVSTEIARISTLPKYELSEAIEGIYEIYIQFINQLYFKEVTEEFEGACIYEALSKVFKIEEELNQLNYEVDEVHEYATLIEQAASNVKVQILTIIGAALVLPNFVTGFFGMNLFKEEALRWWENRQVILWLNSYFFLPTLAVIALCTWTKRKSTKYRLMKLLIMSLMLLSASFVIKYGCGL